MRRFFPARALPLVIAPLGFLLIATPAVHAQQAKPQIQAKSVTKNSRKAPPLPLRKPVRSLDNLRSQLDYKDQLIAMRALHLALTQVPDGGSFVWRKNSRSLKGLIKPTKAFRNADGQICRHLVYALSLGRYLKQIEGVACRTGDGTWQLKA